MNSSCGICFVITARHAVNGVANSSPTGPHSQVQNAIAISMASLEVPALRLNSIGSMTITTTDSSTANRAITDSGCHQFDAVARLTANGRIAAIQMPM